MKYLKNCLAVGILAAVCLAVSQAKLLEDDVRSVRSIEHFRQSLFHPKWPRETALSRGMDVRKGSRDSGEEDEKPDDGSKENSEENGVKFHDSPWVPIGVIFGFILIASIAFVVIQRRGKTRPQQTEGRTDGQTTYGATAPPEVIVTVSPERLKKISKVVPVAQGPVVRDPGAPGVPGYMPDNQFFVDNNEPPPAYETIVGAHLSSDAWMQETVTIPTRTSPLERY